MIFGERGGPAGVALALVLLAGCADDAARDPEARYQSLIAELRCLVCQNQSIAESNAPLAEDLRAQVRQQIAQGRSDEQIGAFLTDRYGDFVLYRPPFRARTLVLWLGPFAALALAALAAALYIRRRDRSVPTVDEAPADAGAAAQLPAGRIGAGAYAGALTGLLLFGVLWYAVAGSWRTQALVGLSESHPEAAEAAALDVAIAQARAQAEADPRDAAAWAMVARGEARRGRFGAAAQAMAEANRLTAGQNPDWLVEEGEALAWVHDGELAGAPLSRFQAALVLAPDHPRALWYAGLAALHAGDRANALTHWQRLSRQELPDDVRAVIQQKVAELGGPPPAPAAPRGAAAAGGVRLTLEVRVAEAVAALVPPGATLLVYALEPGGPRMPLAVHRQAAGPGPWLITLDDSKSMVADRKLSSVDRWQVLARISASGNATPQAGDLQGQVDIAAGQAGTLQALVIDRKL